VDTNLASSPRGLDENLSQDEEFLVQITNHVQRQRPPALQDLIYTRSLADDPDQCLEPWTLCSNRNLIASIGSGQSIG
jgi:hypothetical protein